MDKVWAVIISGGDNNELSEVILFKDKNAAEGYLHGRKEMYFSETQLWDFQYDLRELSIS